MTMFTPHGNLDISVKDNVVTIDIEGAMNLEFFKQMEADLAKVGPQLSPGKYAAHVILRGDALASPDATEYFTNYMVKVDVAAVAISLQYADSALLTEMLCSKAYTKANINHQFFTNDHQAKEWLLSYLS